MGVAGSKIMESTMVLTQHGRRALENHLIVPSSRSKC